MIVCSMVRFKGKKEKNRILCTKNKQTQQYCPFRSALDEHNVPPNIQVGSEHLPVGSIGLQHHMVGVSLVVFYGLWSRKIVI